MNSVWISAIGLCGATLIGAVLGFGIKELPHKWNDTVLGYCAGIMLAASTLGLIVPAFEEAGTSGWWMVVIGVMVGALFLNVLDLVTPHLHHITGLDEEQHRNNASLNHILLFVMAIACTNCQRVWLPFRPVLPDTEPFSLSAWRIRFRSWCSSQCSPRR